MFVVWDNNAINLDFCGEFYVSGNEICFVHGSYPETEKTILFDNETAANRNFNKIVQACFNGDKIFRIED